MTCSGQPRSLCTRLSGKRRHAAEHHNSVCCLSIITIYFYWMESECRLGHGLGDRRLVVLFLVRASDFLLSETSRPALMPTQPFFFSGYKRRLRPKLKRPKHEAYYSPQFEWMELQVRSLPWLNNMPKALILFSWMVWCLRLTSVFLHKMDWFLSCVMTFFQLHYLCDVEFWRCEW